MKVYTRVVLDWEGNVLEEESFQYEGDVSHCGGSSGGGGSSSGKHDWPSYMKNRHSLWLSRISALIPGYNPYTQWESPSISPITSATTIADYVTYLENRAAQLYNLSYSPNVRESELLQALYTFTLNQIDYLSSHLGDAYEIDERVPLIENITKLSDRLTALESVGDLEGIVDLHTVVLPRFEAGMRDINAVQASTFVIGRGVIEATYQAKMQEAKHNWLIEVEKLRTTAVSALSNLQIDARKANQNYRGTILGLINNCLQLASTSGASLDNIRMEIDKFKANINMEIKKIQASGQDRLDGLYDAMFGKDIELRRIRVVAAAEQATTNMEMLEKRYRWTLENYQYGANMLGAISGGTAGTSTGKTNKVASALGGALSGAAMGAAIGGAPGAAIGGIVGLGASLLG